MLSKFVLPGIAFVLTLAFGFWVSHLGRPYNGLLFNVHKLIALGAVIATIVQLTKVLKNANALVLIIVLLVVAALCVIALFASGAFMSIGNVDYGLMLTVHRIAPVLLVTAMICIFITLKGGVS
jgi:chromate transport protein ChrA